MPTVSKQQYRLMKAAETNPDVAKRIGISQEKAKEFTSKNVGKKRFSKLKEKLSKK